MKNIAIIFLTFLSLSLYSQTNEKLDNKNGFKDLKFGELISKYKDNLTPISGTKDEFEYESDKNKSLFGWEWQKCFTSFNENRLVSIGVFWKDEENVHSSLLRDLNKVFGESKKTSEILKIKESNGLNIDIWEGQNVIMILSRDTQGIDSPPCEKCNISLVMLSNKLPSNKELENDF